MNRIETVTTSVRPIRKLFILNDQDISTFYKLIRLTSKEIAGITNLILPYGPELFEENATQFVSQHSPDIILNYSSGDRALIEKHFRTETFSSPPLDEVRRLASTPIRIWDNIPPFFSQALTEKGPKVYSVIAEENDNLDIFTSLHFGIVPPDFQTSLHRSIFKHVSLKNVTPQNIARYLHDHDHNLLYLTLGLSMGRGGGWSIYEKSYNPNGFFDRKPTLIIGSTSNLRSLLYFWNSRAAYPFNTTTWAPIELIKELPLDWSTYTHIAITIPEASDNLLITHIMEGKQVIDGSRYYFSRHMDHWTSFEHTSSTVVVNGRVNIDHPSVKLFSRNGINMDVALDIRGLEEISSPPSATAGALFAPKDTSEPFGFSRIGVQGLSKRIRQFEIFHEAPILETIQLPDDFSIIEALLQEQGISIQLAKSTAIVEQLKKLLGGYGGAHILASETALSLIHLLAPKRTKRIIQELKDAGLDFGEQRNQDIAQHLSTLPVLGQATTRTITQLEGALKIRKEDKAKFYDLLQVLYTRNMLLRGKSLHCPYCKTRLWYPLESLTRPLTCYCCDSPISLPVAPNAEADDSYRLNELLIQAVDQGILAVLLTMRLLWSQHFFGKRLLANVETRDKDANNKIVEIDIIFTLGRDLGFCEVKTEQAFDLQQSDELVDLAEKVMADVVIFSTLNEETSETVLELKEHLESRKPRLPILILTRGALISSEVLSLSEFYRVFYLRDGNTVFII